MKRPFIALVLVVALIVLSAMPLLTGARGYTTYVMYLVFQMIVLTIAWDFAGGLAGLLSLGNAAFFGVGAYAAAILVKAGLELVVALVVAGIIAAGTAIVLSISIKLRGVYFIMSTLFLAQIIQILMLNWTPVTGGGSGFFLLVPPNFNFVSFYYISMITMVAAAAGYYLLQRSWIGLSLRAIGNDEDAARSLGINPVKYKVFALVFSAFFTGIMGGLYANVALFIDPSSAFSISRSLDPMFAAIIGGMGTLWGGVIGGVIMVLLVQLLVPIGPISIVIQSTIMIAVILVWRAGIYGTILKRFGHPRTPVAKKDARSVVQLRLQRLLSLLEKGLR